jgi:uncharacterized protein YuzE
MKITYDKQADAMYIKLNDRDVAYSEENPSGVVVDFDDNGDMVGIELLEVSKRTDSPEDMVYELA